MPEEIDLLRPRDSAIEEPQRLKAGRPMPADSNLT
jgi:hypothetical protein